MEFVLRKKVKIRIFSDLNCWNPFDSKSKEKLINLFLSLLTISERIKIIDIKAISLS
jgi:hypothetical protein